MKEHHFEVTFKGTPYQAFYLTSLSSAEKALSKLMQKEVLFAIDTETMALPEYKHIPEAALSPLLSKVRLLQVFDGKSSIIFDLLHIGRDDLFLSFLQTKRFIAHYAIFDYQFFRCMGVEKMDIGCTSILLRLLYHAMYPTDAGLSASLQTAVNDILQEPAAKKHGSSDWSVPELTFEQIEYAALDAVYVMKVAERISKGLSKYGLERIYKLCKAVQAPIAEMQLNGLRLDVEKHRANVSTWRDELYQAKKKVLQMTGLKDLTSHTLADYLERTLPKDILAIWPVTETGKLSTSSDTFADFSFLPIVKPFSEFQKKEKMSSTYGMGLIRRVNPRTNRIHAHYHICGARTGRLSSSKPNLQNLPRGTDIRTVFIPSDGKVFLCADYSQIELRVGAELSRDKEMLRAYREGIDLHKLTASKIGRKPLAEVTSDERFKAKAFNFGLMFGLGSKKFSHYARKSYGVEVSEDEAVDSINIFRTTYAGYREWQLKQAESASVTFTCRTPCGKLRKLPEDNTYGNSMNHPVQGGASEAMLYALTRIHQYRAFMRLVNCVHDEILVEVNPHEICMCKELLSNCMVEGFQDVFPNGITRDLVEVKDGTSWGAAK